MTGAWLAAGALLLVSCSGQPGAEAPIDESVPMASIVPAGPATTDPSPERPAVAPATRPELTTTTTVATSGVDGPVAYGAPQELGEEALFEGVLELDGGCLRIDGQLVLWPFGTQWQPEPPAVISPLGAVVEVGEFFESGGGGHTAGDIMWFAPTADVATYVRSCGDESIAVLQDPTFARSSSPPEAPTADDATVLGWIELTEDEQPARFENIVPTGFVEIGDCRWVGVGTFEFDVVWSPGTADVEYPVDVTLALIAFVAQSGPVVVGRVTLARPGAFTLALEQPAWRRPDDDLPSAWRIAQGDLSLEQGATCTASTGGDRWSERPARVATAPTSGAPDGTLEAFAAAGDPFDPSDPGRLVDALLRQPGLPGLDVVHLAPDEHLELIEVEREGCLAVRTLYDDGDSVEVLQRAGCPADGRDPPESGRVREIVDAPPWTITVDGRPDDVARVLAGLRALPSVREATPPSVFDPDGFLDARSTDFADGIELGRFDWAGGKLAVWSFGLSNWGHQLEVVEALPVLFDAGGFGTKCESWSVHVSAGEGRGYAAVVVAGDRTVRYDADGAGGPARPTEIGSVPATGLDGWSVALIDLTGDPAAAAQDHRDVIDVLDADGRRSPCVQRSL